MIGIGTLLNTSWRPNGFESGYVEQIPANFGTLGSVRRDDRSTGTGTPHTVTGPMRGSQDPRILPYNGLTPIVWRIRDVDAAKLAAVEAKSRQQFGAPVVFTPPMTASLLTGGSLV